MKHYVTLLLTLCSVINTVHAMGQKNGHNSPENTPKKVAPIPQNLRDHPIHITMNCPNATFVYTIVPNENNIQLAQDQSAQQHQEDRSVKNTEQQATKETDVTATTNNTSSNDVDHKTDQHTNQDVHQEARHETNQQTEQNNQQKNHNTLEAHSTPNQGLGENPSILFSLINKKNFLLATGTAATVYAVYYLVSYRTKSLLHCQKAWCNWDYTNTLNGSHKMLTHELLRKIQTHYTNPKNPSDYTTSIATFLEALDYEAYILNQYLTSMRLGAAIKLHTILPGGDMRAIAHEKLKTISFLRSVFLEWARGHQEKALGQ